MERWPNQVSNDYQSDDSSKFESNMDDDKLCDEIAEDNRLRTIIQEDQECTLELNNQGLNELIKLKALKQLMNMAMEGLVDECMNDISFEEDDYEDWLKWVVHEKQQNMQQFEGRQVIDVPSLFQLNITKDGQFQTIDGSNMANERGWDQIKILIKDDLDLDQEKAKRFWQVLENYVDVFTWHKRELGCCVVGEHVIDT